MKSKDRERKLLMEQLRKENEEFLRKLEERILVEQQEKE